VSWNWLMGVGNAAAEGWWSGDQMSYQPCFNAQQNQMAALYNQQYSGSSQAFVALQPPVTSSRQADCEGCGAPLKAYIHHCEYCRRPK
jgi:hypothetical protein